MTPAICTPEWAVSRIEENRDEGGRELLRLMTQRLKDGVPQCHIRFADGEFWSILGRVGPNADGQEHLPETLGKELKETLFDIRESKLPNVTVGGYWFVPVAARDWLAREKLLTTLPWCPVSAFITEIVSGLTMEFLKALRDSPGRKFLVANAQVCKLALSIKAVPVIVTLPEKKLRENISPVPIHTPNTPGWYGSQNAYTDMPGIEHALKHTLRPGDSVVWCAGLGCKPSLWRMFRDSPGTSHFDMGCFLDLAAGLVSRTWMTEPPDEQGRIYREQYIPWLKGEAR